MTGNDKTPNPGSAAAIKAGCICDTWDNNENIRLVPGRGLVFSLHDLCPLHGIGTDYYAEHIEPDNTDRLRTFISGNVCSTLGTNG